MAEEGARGVGGRLISVLLALAVLALCAWPVLAAVRGLVLPDLRTLGGLIMALGVFVALSAMTESARSEGFSVRSHWGGLGGGMGGWSFSRPFAFGLIAVALATAATAAMVPAASTELGAGR